MLPGFPCQRRRRAADPFRLCRSGQATSKDACVTVGASLLPSLPQELFVKVVPFHCLGCVWSQRDKKEKRNLAPGVRATISQFNAVTNRVITSLLCPFAPGPSTSSPVPSPGSSSTFVYPAANLNSPDSAQGSPAHRARLIERWISIAQVWNLYICSPVTFRYLSLRLIFHHHILKILNVILALKFDLVSSFFFFPLQECRQFRNFSSLRAILSALQSNAVYRLKKTWAAVSRSAGATKLTNRTARVHEHK